MNKIDNPRSITKSLRVICFYNGLLYVENGRFRHIVVLKKILLKNTLFTGVDKVSWLVLTFSLADETALDWEKVEADARRSFGESCQKNFDPNFELTKIGNISHNFFQTD